MTLCAIWEGEMVDTHRLPEQPFFNLRTTCAMLMNFCLSEQNLVIIISN